MTPERAEQIAARWLRAALCATAAALVVTTLHGLDAVLLALGFVLTLCMIKSAEYAGYARGWKARQRALTNRAWRDLLGGDDRG